MQGFPAIHTVALESISALISPPANILPDSETSPDVHPRNLSLMITFGNKLQDMLTTVASSIYPHRMPRRTFWDQFQSRIN